MPDMVARLLIASFLVLAAFGGYALYNHLLLRRLQNQRITSLQGNKPVLLYFTTPTCAPCKTIQRPAIERLRAAIGERLEIIEIDANDDPGEASRWGVMSVPTTILLDRNGQARVVNHGVTVADRLLKQVKELID